ncbi:MAG: FHIPEP family type III secretion protein [Deltaproteobacteria bacterium]|nr:FHIPEP family type III secretion protein [Deltaproteobacteria bacterium]
MRDGDVGAFLSRYSDLALAALVVSIVGMMIIPLPTWLLDLLISLNIAVAVTLLLISIYVTDALRIATFPTLLLLTTLFRLALEVSATRLILLKGDAGDVIHAFGNFVVAGNLVVGAVIFLILTIIQFIVISKGSERVAEVAARFTLDAMPGKQMSIDAELRAGHIDHDEARRRRSMLARESQLFGSMDGAMKFVKGDAIAGLVVLAVNIVGGLTIGVLQRGMDLASAARTYTVLTIGEGLVAQIPALVISTSAGIIVTRVASEEEGSHLGRDIAGQILGQPKAIAIAAGLLALLAIVPGMPTIPFLILAAILGFVAYRLLRPRTAGAGVGAVGGGDGISTAGAGLSGAGAGMQARGPRAGGRTGSEIPSPVLTPIAVELGAALSARLCPRDDGAPLADRLTSLLRPRLFAELGIPLPLLRVRPSIGGLAPNAFVLRLNEIPLGRGTITSDVQDQDQQSDSRTSDAELAAADLADTSRLADDLLILLRRYGHEFIGIQETQSLLEALERTHPALVREVVPKLIAPALLADVLRRLVEEGISLRNLKDILGALAEWAPSERDPVTLTEHVRTALRRAITYRHASTAGVLSAYLLDPVIEETVREAIHKTATGSYLALEPQLSRDIVQAVGRAIGSGAAAPGGGVGGDGGAGSSFVILTSVDIRRYVRRLIETDFPKIAVLAYPELAPEAQIQALGRIRI